MNDPLLRVALLGTGRELALNANPAFEGLLPEALTPERRLLLLAGMDAVARRAGYRPARRDEAPPAAPDETRLPCPPRVARIVADLFAGNRESLLGEAARLIARAGRRVPPEVLPAILSLDDAKLRKAFLPTLGERGVWLSRFSDDWSWVREVAAIDREDAKRLWDEGLLLDRMSLIRRLRSSDPAAARALCESSWKEERADHRAWMIGALREGLGPEDEAFLESALDDRSMQVRAAAAPLLARIEGSALSARMEARIDELIAPAPGPAGLPGNLRAADARPPRRATPAKPSPMRPSLRLAVKPPSKLAPDWERDGIPRNPPRGVGAKSFWLARTLALVRPRHFEARFSASAAEIAAAAVGAEDEALALLRGFTQATLLFGEKAWAAPLADAWLAHEGDDEEALDRLRELFRMMSPDEGAARVPQLSIRVGSRLALSQVLSFVEEPWSAEFSMSVAQATLENADDPDFIVLIIAAHNVTPAGIPQLDALLARTPQQHLSGGEHCLAGARETLRIRAILEEDLRAPGRGTA